jgi:2-hydroxychromene-2-carboxylate isomerase
VAQDRVTIHHSEPDAAGPAFYFDLGNPEAYLAAERVLQVMPVATPWIPVLERDLGSPAEMVDRDAFTTRAGVAGLQPVRWPDPFPFDSEPAMLAATYARSIGRVVPFALAAFRQAFAGGRALSSDDAIVIAGSGCEMHPRALLTGSRTRGTRDALQRETALAVERGVTRVPAVWVPGASGADGRVFDGAGGLERAAAACEVLAS